MPSNIIPIVDEAEPKLVGCMKDLKAANFRSRLVVRTLLQHINILLIIPSCMISKIDARQYIVGYKLQLKM